MTNNTKTDRYTREEIELTIAQLKDCGIKPERKGERMILVSELIQQLLDDQKSLLEADDTKEYWLVTVNSGGNPHQTIIDCSLVVYAFEWPKEPILWASRISEDEYNKLSEVIG